MRCPVSKLKKKDIIWLNNHYCKKHRMPYLQHYQCYLKDEPSADKIGFLDIESGASLTADFGYTLSYCILPLYGKMISNIITSGEIHNAKIRDKRLVKDFCKDVKGFTKLVVYFGRDGNHRHDLPFLRTRALKWKIKGFPKVKEMKVIDMYDAVKTKLKLYRRRQTDACRILGIKFSDHPVIPEIWQSALCGEKKALKYILQHNKEDVEALRGLFLALIDYRNTESTT